jgi:hypothetical protein
MPAKPEPPPNAPPALPELAPEAPPAVAERPTVTFEAGPRVKIVVDRLTSTDPTFRKPCNVTAFVHLDGSPPTKGVEWESSEPECYRSATGDKGADHGVFSFHYNPNKGNVLWSIEARVKVEWFFLVGTMAFNDIGYDPVICVPGQVAVIVPRLSELDPSISYINTEEGKEIGRVNMTLNTGYNGELDVELSSENREIAGIGEDLQSSVNGFDFYDGNAQAVLFKPQGYVTFPGPATPSLSTFVKAEYGGGSKKVTVKVENAPPEIKIKPVIQYDSGDCTLSASGYAIDPEGGMCSLTGSVTPLNKLAYAKIGSFPFSFEGLSIADPSDNHLQFSLEAPDASGVFRLKLWFTNGDLEKGVFVDPRQLRSVLKIKARDDAQKFLEKQVFVLEENDDICRYIVPMR